MPDRVRSLYLPLADAIVDHAQTDSPHEACGVLIGRIDPGGVGVVGAVYPVTNTATDPLTTYVMDERSLASLLPLWLQNGYDLIGFYHSHPQGDPIPSQADIRAAAYPDVAWLIVGLKGNEPKLAAWHIANGRVEPIPISTDTVPGRGNTFTVGALFSSSTLFAFVFAALAAVVFLILIALALLPPAPVIPGR